MNFFLQKRESGNYAFFYRNRALLNSLQNDSLSPHFPWSPDFLLLCVQLFIPLQSRHLAVRFHRAMPLTHCSLCKKKETWRQDTLGRNWVLFPALPQTLSLTLGMLLKLRFAQRFGPSLRKLRFCTDISCQPNQWGWKKKQALCYTKGKRLGVSSLKHTIFSSILQPRTEGHWRWKPNPTVCTVSPSHNQEQNFSLLSLGQDQATEHGDRRGGNKEVTKKSHDCLNFITYRSMDSSGTQILTKMVSISPAFALTAFLLP